MKKGYLFVLLALGAIACSDDEDQDTTAPQILAATINGEDHDLVFNSGDNLQVELDLSDNEALGELKLDIHDIFDGHDHNKRGGDAWELTEIIQVSGASSTLTHSLSVPDPVLAGPYHVIFRLLDAAGNESEFKELDFLIQNGEEPLINISAPDFSNEVHVSKGQNLSLVGTISDDVDLDEIIITIEEEEEHDHKNSSGLLFSYDEDLPGSSDTSFDLSTVTIPIPGDAETGHYELRISAKDSDGNYGQFTADIHVM